MPVKSVLIDIYIPSSRSLKNKRSVVQGMLKKIRNRFNVSAAEIDGLDKWQQAVVGITVISNSAVILEKTHSDIISFIEHNYSDVQVSAVRDYI